MKKLFLLFTFLLTSGVGLTGCETLRYYVTDPDPVKDVKDRWEAKLDQIEDQLDLEGESIQKKIDRYRKTGVLSDLNEALKIIQALEVVQELK